MSPAYSSELVRIPRPELEALCRRALFRGARQHWRGPRPVLRRAVRRFLRRHRRDRGQLVSVLRSLAASSSLALPLLGLAPAADGDVFVDRTYGNENPLPNRSVFYTSKPALVDIDADGDLDVFSGDASTNLGTTPGGTFSFFENTGSATHPEFVRRTGSRNPLDGFDVRQFSIGMSAPAFADIDDDGDLDAISGSHYGRFVLIENTGSATSPAFAWTTLDPFSTLDVGDRSTPAFGDVDGDGDLDVVSGIGIVYGYSSSRTGEFAFLENTGSAASPSFVERTGSLNPLDGFDVGDLAAPALADLDGDGDLDVLAGEVQGSFHFFENSGSPTAPAFALRTGSLNPLDGFDVGHHSAPSFGDIDGDGDLDALSGEGAGAFALFENTGSAASPAFAERAGSQNPLQGLDAGTYSVPAFGDLDGDGDRDAVVGRDQLSTNTFAYYENTGSASAPAYVMRTGSLNPLDAFDAGNRPSPALADVDGDGDLDVISGELDGNFAFYENTGSPSAPSFVARTGSLNPLDAFDVGYDSTPALADLDGDADLDLVSGERYGALAFFENTGSASSPGFVARSGSLNPLDAFDVGDRSGPALADLDGDGDLDALAGALSGALAFFENTGTATFPAFAQRTGLQNPLDGLDAGVLSSPAVVDGDGDGDLDVFSGTQDGGFAYFLNPGPADFVPRLGSRNPLDGVSVPGDATPVFADLDDDGDLDVLSGELGGGFAFFENTGTAATPAFVTRTGSLNPLDGFDVGDYSTPALADLDGDGDLDALSGELGGALVFFENTGTASTPAFVIRTGSLNPLDGLDVGDRSAPALADLDGDGDLDAVSGELGGAFAFLENTGTATAPAFVIRTGSLNPLDGLDVGDRSTPALTDLEGDGDLDLVSGERSGTFAFFENTGTASSPGFTPRTGSLNPLGAFDVGYDSAPTLADLDADDDPDAFWGAEAGTFAFFENTTADLPPSFERRTVTENPLFGASVNATAGPALGDLDDDGDLDLVSGEFFGNFAYFENTGSAKSPAFAARTGSANPLDGLSTINRSKPALADLDGDGDLDLVAGEFYGTFFYFENTGNPSTPAFVSRTGSQNPFDGFDLSFYSAPALADVDGDGDLDLLSGEYVGAFFYFENTGNPSTPAFVSRTGSQNPFDGFDVGTHSTPSLVDLDRDGDLDLLSGEYLGALFYFENTGSATSPAFVQRVATLNPLFGFDVGSRSAPAAADLDGDGDVDVVSGVLGGSFAWLENVSPVRLPVPGWARLGAALGLLAGLWRRRGRRRE